MNLRTVSAESPGLMLIRSVAVARRARDTGEKREFYNLFARYLNGSRRRASSGFNLGDTNPVYERALAGLI